MRACVDACMVVCAYVSIRVCAYARTHAYKNIQVLGAGNDFTVFPQAIENISNLQMGKWQQLMVPIKEMVDVLKVVREVSGIKRGSWLCIKRGMLKDDIARVSHMLYVCICNSTHIVVYVPSYTLHTCI